jgi:tetratricopeptide (TPR) repeat protein
MFSFNYKATSTSGETFTSRVEAKSAADAWEQLQKNGYSEIEVLDDEYSAIKLDDNASVQRLKMSAKVELSLRQQDTLGGRILWSLRQSRNVMIWLPLLLGFVYYLFNKESTSTDVAIYGSLLLVYLAWFVWATIPSVLYWQAQEASAWYRWGEVERWMQWLARWKRWFNIPFSEHELLFRTATAMAGQGRLDEALRLVEGLAENTELAPGFYQTRLASLFFAAKNYTRAAQLQQEARTINPSASATIDLAFTMAKWIGDYQTARELLDEIDIEKINPLAKIFVFYARGIVAIDLKEYDVASRFLEDALTLGKNHFGTPLMKTVMAGALAYHGLGLAGLGRLSDAKRFFDLAKPLLEACQDTQLLAQCEAAQNKG